MESKPNPGLFRKKPTYNELLDLLERDEDKIQLPERIGLSFMDSFAMGQYKEMVQQQQEGGQRVAEHQQMDAAMTNAATEEGVNRQELLGFMQQMQAANSSAQAQLQEQLNASISGQQRANETHAAAIAQQIATHTRKQDDRDTIVGELRQSLAQAHQTPQSVPIPPAPSTTQVHNHYTQHITNLQPSVTTTASQDPALAQMLAAGQATSDQRANAQGSYLQTLGMNLGNAVRHMQAQGSGLNDILQGLMARNAQGPQQSIRGGLVAQALTGGDDQPPPPPGSGAVAIKTIKNKLKKSQTPDEMLDRLIAKEEKKRNKNSSPPAPMPIEAITAQGSKRKADTDLQRRNPLQPAGPTIPDRHFIGEPDPEPTKKLAKMGVKIAAKLAQRMVANKKRAVTSVQESTDPWEMLFGSDAENDADKATNKFHKAVKKQANVTKPVLKKNIKKSAFDRPMQKLTYV